jgi:hypothetical protein
MKIWKNIIRIWFTLASLTSFLFGWSILAHAPKPNQFNPSDVPALPKLDPVPTFRKVMFMQQENMAFSNQRALVLRSGGS